MFNRSIVAKLTAGFALIVIVSMFITGIVFIQMFKTYTFESREATLLERGRIISNAVNLDMNGSGQVRGFGGMMKFIDNLAEANVWVTDINGTPIALQGMGMGMNMGHQFSSGPLTAEAEKLLKDVLSGKESVSRSFSSIYKEDTLTVGVPIYDNNKKIIGSVLLHAPVTGITLAVNKAVRILFISTLAALVLAIIMGISYALRFTKPLKTMNNAALQMVLGNYNVRTEINRTDEIGQLGTSIDILAKELGTTIEQLHVEKNLMRDFVANVSHEFRTPLTIIKGSLEALSDGTIENKEDVKLYYERMLSETRGLESLVSDLLELSKFQAGKTSINAEKLHIPSIMSDAVKSMQTLANKKKITIDLSIPDIKTAVFGDYDKIRQLFIIFIDNAIKYSPEGAKISIKFITTNWYEIFIQDTGYGISKEQLPFIWDRFYKADDARKSSGTGLGLAIAKHLIDMHKGIVEVFSEIDKGTTVIIKLPIYNEKDN